MSQTNSSARRVFLSARGGFVAAPDMANLLTNATSAATHAILWNHEEKVLQAISGSAPDGERWHAGILFGQQFELRWRPKRDRVAVGLLREGDGLADISLPEGMNASEQHELCRTDVCFQLWGEHQRGDQTAAGDPLWHEAQIPRLLPYPVATEANAGWPANMALCVAHYETDQNDLLFTRFVAVEGWTHA